MGMDTKNDNKVRIGRYKAPEEMQQGCIHCGKVLTRGWIVVLIKADDDDVLHAVPASETITCCGRESALVALFNSDEEAKRGFDAWRNSGQKMIPIPRSFADMYWTFETAARRASML